MDPMTQVAKAIQAVDSKTVVVRTGTVLSGNSSSTTGVTVALDNDPSGTPVSAISAAGNLTNGTRVIMLAYPPQGLVVLGRTDESAEFTNLTVDNLLTTLNETVTGTLTTANEVISGTLTAPNMRATGALVTASYNLVTSTSYGTNANIPGFNFTYPASGTVLIFVRSAIQWSSGGPIASGDGVCFSFNVRDTNSGGTIRTAANDDQSLICRLYAGAGVGNAAPSGAVQPAMGAPAFTEYYGSMATLVTGLPTSGAAFIQPMTRTLSAPAGPFWAASRTEYIVVPQP